MMMIKPAGHVIFILITAIISSCASKAPTIAHTHIGHATTAWHDTPNQEGLMVVAEKKATQANAHAEKANTQTNELDQAKAEIGSVLKDTDPQSTDSTAAKAEPSYGLKQALIGSVDHITFAADSDDATQNVRVFASHFAEHATGILERCDLITALGKDVISSSSREEVEILAQEILILTKANLEGIDSNGDGEIGRSPEEYGIRQLASDLQAMIDREDPPYSTVETWYLFNLIKLPSGEWRFSEKRDSGGSSGYGRARGGGY